MLGQAVGALTDAAHGMTLSAVALPYYRLVMPHGLSKFVRFATAVWDVNPAGKTDEQVAEEGLSAMEAWMREIGCVMSISEFGCNESMIDDLANAALTMQGGYHVLTHDGIKDVFKGSLEYA